MAIFLLVIVYLSCISLGLGDLLLGTSWAVMRLDIGADLAAAGIVSMCISGGFVVASLLSDRVLRLAHTSNVLTVGVFVTATALVGFSFAPSFWWVVAAAVPLGLAGGTIDAAANIYVAHRYKPRYLSWMHCFWGVGATSGPLIMSLFLMQGGNWRGGYRAVSAMQYVVFGVLLCALPVWRKADLHSHRHTAPPETTRDTVAKGIPGPRSVLAIRGVPIVLLSGFLYCGIEMTASVWGSSFLVDVRGIHPAQAAQWISVLFGGLMVGRLVTGVLTIRWSGRQITRVGQGLMLLGAASMLVPGRSEVAFVGLVLLGLGCAPVYPCLIHETPRRFGPEHSQKIIGLQMACAYMGNLVLPPVSGYVASTQLGLRVYPVLLIIYILLMVLSCETLNGLYRKKAMAAN